MDQLSSFASQMTTLTKERDCWKSKYQSLEKKYDQLIRASMMLPTDESTCEWIRTVYDAIQRKANHTINFEAESAKLGMSSSLLQYCVNLSKPPAATARKMFQYKLWDRKAIKISLQNFIRGERANMKQDQHAHGVEQ
ncbi:unnamed protein product [Rotaria sp. Silwood1]|nr:unnamed protein product [Rotaria sp. Silwood1]